MPNQFVPPSTPPRVSKPHKPMVMRTPSTFQPVTPVKITESFATPYTGVKIHVICLKEAQTIRIKRT